MKRSTHFSSNRIKYELTNGEGRTKVNLLAYHMGKELIVCIYNENAHIGAHSITRYTKKPVCVIAGIHIHNITRQEIDQVLENTTSLIDKFLSEIE